MPTLRKGRGTGATPGQQAQDDPSFDPGSGSDEEEEEPTEPSARGGSELEETISAALKPLMDRLRALEDRRDTPEEVELVSEDKGDPKGGEGDDPSGSGGDGDSSGGVAPDDGDVEGADEDEEYSPYAAANPYERPLAQVPAPHLWELSDTPGCQDYKIALRDKDRAVHELKMLHAVLSYLHDAIEDLGGLLGARADGGGTQLRRIFRTLDATKMEGRNWASLAQRVEDLKAHVYAAKTRANYGTHYRKFQRFCQELQLDPCRRPSRAQLETYIAWLPQNGISANSIPGYLSGLNATFRHHLKSAAPIPPSHPARLLIKGARRLTPTCATPRRPLPPSIVMGFIIAGLSTIDPSCLQAVAAIILAVITGLRAHTLGQLRLGEVLRVAVTFRPTVR